MSLLQNIQVKEKIVTVDYPDIEGFTVQVAFLPREELVRIRNNSLVYKFNKMTRTREESVDNDRFLAAYAERVIKGWSGLKIKHLPLLMAVDISQLDPEKDVPYNADDALELLQNSVYFDQFITDTVGDLQLFSDTKKETDVKN